MVKDVLYNDEDVQSDTLLCQSEQFFYIDFIFLLHWTILGYFVKKEIAPLVEPSIESWEATHLGAPLEHLHQIENKWPPFPITKDKGDWMQKKISRFPFQSSFPKFYLIGKINPSILQR
jgi:hypothetical protein